MDKRDKRVVIISDLHCGNLGGLTPPGSQINQLQIDLYNWYVKKVKEVGRIDLLIGNGDMIEGPSERTRGVGLSTTDSLAQVKMAEQCIREWDYKKILLTYGTPYHTGKAENYEEVLADRLGALIDNEHTFSIEGVQFNVKHKTGGGNSLNGGLANGAIKDQRWNILNASIGEVEKADIVIRSHLHRFAVDQDAFGFSITTPALQFNSSYGARQCSGHTDYGFISFTVKSKGEWSWKRHLLNPVLKKKPVLII